MTKAQMRSRYLYQRDNVDLKTATQKSEEILAAVTRHPKFIESKMILTYVGVKSEVETMGIIEAAWRLGKRVAVPKTYRGGRMAFYEMTNPDQLHLSSFGVLEPSGEGEAVEPEAGTLCIVPGVVFDRNLNRMGYGAGFYDRYLAEHPGLFKMAVAFECQMAELVPTDEFDARMDLILTESGSYR